MTHRFKCLLLSLRIRVLSPVPVHAHTHARTHARTRAHGRAHIHISTWYVGLVAWL